MKKILILISILFTNLLSFGQIYLGPDDPETLDGQAVYIAADTMPKFVGGENALQKFIQTNITESLREQDLKVFVSIIIDKYGVVREPKILYGKKEVQNNESLRIIKIMSKWIPGRLNGKIVYVQQTIKFDFSPKK